MSMQLSSSLGRRDLAQDVDLVGHIPEDAEDASVPLEEVVRGIF